MKTRAEKSVSRAPLLARDINFSAWERWLAQPIRYGLFLYKTRSDFLEEWTPDIYKPHNMPIVVMERCIAKIKRDADKYANTPWGLKTFFKKLYLWLFSAYKQKNDFLRSYQEEKSALLEVLEDCDSSNAKQPLATFRTDLQIARQSPRTTELVSNQKYDAELDTDLTRQVVSTHYGKNYEPDELVGQALVDISLWIDDTNGRLHRIEQKRLEDRAKAEIQRKAYEEDTKRFDEKLDQTQVLIEQSHNRVLEKIEADNIELQRKINEQAAQLERKRVERRAYEAKIDQHIADRSAQLERKRLELLDKIARDRAALSKKANSGSVDIDAHLIIIERLAVQLQTQREIAVNGSNSANATFVDVTVSATGPLPLSPVTSSSSINISQPENLIQSLKVESATQSDNPLSKNHVSHLKRGRSASFPALCQSNIPAVGSSTSAGFFCASAQKQRSRSSSLEPAIMKSTTSSASKVHIG